MIMTAFTPVYAESTDDTAAVDWEKGDNIKAIKEKGVITVATGTYVPFEYRDDDNNIVGFDIDLAQYLSLIHISKGLAVLAVWMIVSLLVLAFVGWIIFGNKKTKR